MYIFHLGPSTYIGSESRGSGISAHLYIVVFVFFGVAAARRLAAAKSRIKRW